MTRTAYTTGLAAERICRLALRLKFYRILAARYKTPVGEIDIIAARGNTVIAVEVKARATVDAAVESISPQQQRRIANALQAFLMRNPRFGKADLRFDIMLATPKRWPLHIKNAWMTE
ncbi:MAG: YraN family protein [Alphaproteobacteria bacterium]|nr:YraN family protein [Alphaproteobacteria bacterium]